LTQSQPPITHTTHTLSFDKPSPRNFKRLCLWLVCTDEGDERTAQQKSRQSSGDFGTVLGKRGKSSCSRQSRVRDDGHLPLQRAQLLEQSGYPVRYLPCHVGFVATGTHLSGHVLDDSYRVFQNKGDSCLLLGEQPPPHTAGNGHHFFRVRQSSSHSPSTQWQVNQYILVFIYIYRSPARAFSRSAFNARNRTTTGGGLRSCSSRIRRPYSNQSAI
jgi:hypothetical protein